MDIYKTDQSFPLTFNDITKLCTDLVLVDPVGRPSNFQWHRFQLVEIAKLLDILIIDEWTGQVKSRCNLGNDIKEKQKEIPDYSPDIPDNLQRYGLIPQKSTELLMANLGGIPSQPLEFQPGGIDVIFTDQTKYVYQEPTESKSLLSPGRDGAPRGLNPIITTMESRRQNSNICFSGGPLWFDNKCYLDSVIMILFQPSPTNLIRTLIVDRLHQFVGNLDNQPESDVVHELLLLDEKFQNYEILHLRNLTRLLQRVKHLSLSDYYTTNLPQDSQEALHNLLDVIQLDYRPANIYQEWQVSMPMEGMGDESCTGYGPNNNHLLEPDILYDDITRSQHWEYNDIDHGIIIQQIPIGSLDFNDTDNIQLSELLNYQVDKPLPDDFVKTSQGWSYHPDSKTFNYVDSEGNNYVIVPEETHLDDEVYYYIGDDKLTSDITITTGLEIGTTKYKRQIIQYQIKQANFLIMNLSRGKATNEPIINYTIRPDQTIQLENRMLRLQSLVCYAGNINNGHYYSYYRCNDIWFKYNDIGCDIEQVGDYDTLVGKKDVTQQGCIFMYQPDE